MCRPLTIRNRTVASRGVLALSPKDSWLPSPGDSAQFEIVRMASYDYAPMSFMAWDATIAAYSTDLKPEGQNKSLGWTVNPEDISSLFNSPDPTISSIFTSSLELTNGSAAKALSTIITILSSMAYYDQFPYFAETANDVSTTYFETFLFPQSFRGFTAVLAITVAHCLLVFSIMAVFISHTRLTTLGDHWQSISQMVSPATDSFLAKSSCATDKEYERT